MGYVFVSYCRDDRDTVRRFVDDLTRHGIPVKWDEGLKGGRWREQLQTAIEGADAVVVCLSSALAQRTHSVVYEEIRFVGELLNQRNPKMPPFLWLVRIGDCDIPRIHLADRSELPQHQAIDLFPGDHWAPGIAKLVQDIRDHYPGTHLPQGPSAAIWPTAIPDEVDERRVEEVGPTAGIVGFVFLVLGASLSALQRFVRSVNLEHRVTLWDIAIVAIAVGFVHVVDEALLWTPLRERFARWSRSWRFVASATLKLGIVLALLVALDHIDLHQKTPHHQALIDAKTYVELALTALEQGKPAEPLQGEIDDKMIFGLLFWVGVERLRDLNADPAALKETLRAFVKSRGWSGPELESLWGQITNAK